MISDDIVYDFLLAIMISMNEESRMIYIEMDTLLQCKYTEATILYSFIDKPDYFIVWSECGILLMK